jgi:hypothetical protein
MTGIEEKFEEKRKKNKKRHLGTRRGHTFQNRFKVFDEDNRFLD